MDIWLDSGEYNEETLAQLRDHLVQAFKIPPGQADILTNGNSHRIKRDCSSEEAEHLVKQFLSWNISLRIEQDSKETSSHHDHTPITNSPPAFKLASHGETIPTLERDKTPPNVTTDHLHLVTD